MFIVWGEEKDLFVLPSFYFLPVSSPGNQSEFFLTRSRVHTEIYKPILKLVHAVVVVLRCHNFKNGKEASEVTEGIYSRMHWER